MDFYEGLFEKVQRKIEARMSGWVLLPKRTDKDREHNDDIAVHLDMTPCLGDGATLTNGEINSFDAEKDMPRELNKGKETIVIEFQRLGKGTAVISDEAFGEFAIFQNDVIVMDGASASFELQVENPKDAIIKIQTWYQHATPQSQQVYDCFFVISHTQSSCAGR